MGSRRTRVAVAVLALLAVPLVALGRGSPADDGSPIQIVAQRVSSPIEPTPTAGPAKPGVPTRHREVRNCPAGLVALTFDDGPAATVTPVLVHELLHLEVPATFFMVGSRIATAPAAARLVQRSGFTIGNHTWNHPELTALGDPAVRRQLRMTRREMRAVGITPSTLMRPPYGAVNHRILTDVRRLALVPVLWTVDSEDWASGNARQIASRILGALRRHQTNIVLQHDGVTNSPASVAAVPRVVRIARRRGFCFTGLGSRGRPVVPVRSRPDPVGPPAVTGTTTGPASLRALLTR